MILKSITLKNFRQYKNATINFSDDSNKNITIVLGENGHGKTTLVRAFIWALYRVNNFTNKVLLNSEVADAMAKNQTKDVEVSLKLSHNGFDYTITTLERYIKNQSNEIVVLNKAFTRIKKDENIAGINPKEIAKREHVEAEIDSILRSELKDYFFYDGENNKIETVSKTQNTKAAISQMMGIKRIETLKDYFNPNSSASVIASLNQELVSDDIEAVDIQEDINDLCGKLNSLSDDIKTWENELSILDSQLDEKEKILDANKEIYELQKEKKKLEYDIKKTKNDLTKKFSNLLVLLKGNNNPLVNKVLSVIFANENLEMLDKKSNFNNKDSLTHISEEAVDQLIKRGYCLCGAKIEDKNEAYQHLIKAKEYMEPHNYGAYIKRFIETEKTNQIFSRTLEDNIKEKADDYLLGVEEYEDLVERLKTVKSKIMGTVDIGLVQKDIDLIKMQISNLDAKIQYVKQRQIPDIEKDIHKKRERLSKIADNTAQNKLIKECLSYANYIYKLADKKITNKQIQIKTELEKVINEAFTNMYHGDRRIVITDDFKAKTMTYNKQLDNSTGIETVKNFAYVSGILQLLKEKMNEDQDILDGEEIDDTYPLVMDAPFSNTDEEHIRNVCLTLPEYCNQLIMVMIRKDYKIAKDKIANKVGKVYSIEKISESYDKIVEVENV